MANKDLTSKYLESEPDVFADIFNVLLLDDKFVPIRNPEFSLEDIPTEGFYNDIEDSHLRNMFQDVSKMYYEEGQKVCFACFNIENESQVKRTVPIKCLGYKFSTLKKQEQEYTSKRKALLALKKDSQLENPDVVRKVDEQLIALGKFQTIPFVSIVLNFDDKEWDEPTDLSDLNIDSPYSQFDESFHIRVFNVKFFDKKLRSKFKSDFRIFLEMFCTNTLPSELSSVELRHPTKLIDMILAFVRNASLESIRKNIAIKELNGEVVTMGDIFDKIANEAAYEKVIEGAKFCYDNEIDNGMIIRMIKQGLDTSDESAEEIFNREVLGLVTT